MRSPGTFLYDGLDYHDLVTAEEKALGGIGQLFVVFGTVEVFSLRTLDGSPVAGFDEDFAYDPIGNRVSSTDYDETGAARTSTYTANALNQYTARTVPGWASVRGLADADATVAVNGNPAYALASGDLAYFFGSDDFDNSATGGFAELEVSATISDATNDLVSVATNRVFVPPANETYAYDADGNQTLVTTGTGAWQVEYNGENRPVRWTCGDKVLHMAYDHQGRRRFYVEVTAGVTNKLHRFTYDDYVCIARNREIDAQHGVGSDAFVWDPTEPIATRPLMCDLSGGGALLYCHDGNKNVSEAVTPDGTIAAHYEYSSFGKVVLVTSENEDQSTANLNPYRFSSEYADDALGLVYYNYRHYDAGAGRWLMRDWIDESSTVNLYGFCWNDADFFDWIGLLINWYYLDDMVVNDLTEKRLKELKKTLEELGVTDVRLLANTTTDIVGLNAICECKDWQWKFQGASVSLRTTIHMRDGGYGDGKTGPSRKWALDREKEHAKDAREWLQQQRNDKRWNDFAAKQDGMSYPSKEECQKKVSSALRDALNDALLKEAEASRDKWDKSGKHTWKSREGTRKELMSW